jgi:hypothetical protein
MDHSDDDMMMLLASQLFAYALISAQSLLWSISAGPELFIPFTQMVCLDDCRGLQGLVPVASARLHITEMIEFCQ